MCKLKEKDIFVDNDPNTPVDMAQFNKNNEKRNAMLQAKLDKRNKDKKTK